MQDGYSSLILLVALIGIITFIFARVRRTVEHLEDEQVGEKLGILQRFRHRDDFLIVDETGKTLLMQAVTQGFEEGVEHILARASREAVNFATFDGTTALHCAMMTQGNPAIVSRLLSAGADANARDAAGRTPLWLAAHKEDARIVSLLLDYKADPDLRAGRQGMTPLMVAARDGRSAVVSALLDRGADPSLVEKTGKSAADYARENLAVNMGPRVSQNRKLTEMVLRLEEAAQGRLPDKAGFILPDNDEVIFFSEKKNGA
ncbi:ankyrin repeat domain-containing protein [Thiovibrio sp. JS02]